MLTTILDRWKTAVALLGILITLLTFVVKGAMWVQHVNDELAKQQHHEEFYHGTFPAGVK